jgi:hypothetical protein
MIDLKLTPNELKTILKSLKNSDDRELYNKFWRLQFNGKLIKKEKNEWIS